ncbi:sodium- and chloride-dependent betaine transporter-like [Cebidichthys violaceus]|uniref:sodium- and chloride-dependent betaine transporter-like n=1 Tax=Cebidichthys violaceus TaxID=271503 RepID=UPI0035CA4135
MYRCGSAPAAVDVDHNDVTSALPFLALSKQRSVCSTSELQLKHTSDEDPDLEMNRQRRKTENQKKAGDRGQWASKTEYLLVVAGHVVGLGNVWRFPYLCYKNGGGAFLVPYGLLAVVCGIPLFLLETSVGQYTQEGFVTFWRKLCPLAQGIGCGQLVIKFYDFSFIIIEVWALFYLVFSFRAQAPWATCENIWNTANCMGPTILDSPSSNLTAYLTMLKNTTSAATEFWERRVLGMSGGIEELGSVRWELALCLLACWVFCYFCIWKGVRSSGKVVYFTATFPYAMLLILLIRGLTLPGAWEGIYYYLYPDLNRLANLEVWIEAGSQICFSYSLTAGTLNVLGSYNEYNNNCYKDCLWLCLLNSGTSFVAGFVVFSVLGFMAQKQGVAVDAVVESGPGLAFIAYPQATAMMPLPQFWTVCFFLMLILLTVDSHFVAVECFITAISDLFPKLFRKPGRHELLVLFFCSFFFLIHLLLVTEGGIYIFQLVDYYGMTRACHYFMALSECLALAWIFGADRVIDIIEDMTGQRPSVFFKLCWKYVIPLLSLISLILYLVDYKHLRINDWYVYPDWAYALGWTMTLSSVLMVPLWAAGQMCSTAGTFRQRLSVLCRPAEDPAWQRRDEGTTVKLRTCAVTT